MLPSSPFETTEANATLISSLANRGGSVRLASNRRIDVPEKVGGPALHVNAERLGRDRDGELFSDGRRGGRSAIPRRPESRVRSMRRPGRFEDGPGRRGGPQLCPDADEHTPTVQSSRR